MGYDHRKCEDEDDAIRMAETIKRELGDVDVQLEVSVTSLINVARNAERIAKWARAEAAQRLRRNMERTKT